MKVEWFEEAFKWKNPEDLYKVCIIQQKEIERLNKIIGHALGYIECANKVDITYVCKILKGSDKD